MSNGSQTLSRPLEDGDIVNVDITVYLNGYHGDTSVTFLVGEVVSVLFQHAGQSNSYLCQDELGKDLVKASNDALAAAIDACGPGRPFNGIGKVIQELAHSRDFSVSSQVAGHGIGTFFHGSPWIYHMGEVQLPQLPHAPSTCSPTKS